MTKTDTDPTEPEKFAVVFVQGLSRNPPRPTYTLMMTAPVDEMLDILAAFR